MTPADDILNSVGLGDLPPGAKPAYASHFGEQLTLAVVGSLTKMMSEEQFDEFEDYLARPQHVLLAWLEINMPCFRRVMREERGLLQARVAHDAQELLTLEHLYAAESTGDGHNVPKLTP